MDHRTALMTGFPAYPRIPKRDANVSFPCSRTLNLSQHKDPIFQLLTTSPLSESQ